MLAATAASSSAFCATGNAQVFITGRNEKPYRTGESSRRGELDRVKERVAVDVPRIGHEAAAPIEKEDRIAMAKELFGRDRTATSRTKVINEANRVLLQRNRRPTGLFAAVRPSRKEKKSKQASMRTVTRAIGRLRACCRLRNEYAFASCSEKLSGRCSFLKKAATDAASLPSSIASLLARFVGSLDANCLLQSTCQH